MWILCELAIKNMFGIQGPRDFYIWGKCSRCHWWFVSRNPRIRAFLLVTYKYLNTLHGHWGLWLCNGPHIWTGGFITCHWHSSPGCPSCQGRTPHTPLPSTQIGECQSDSHLLSWEILPRRWQGGGQTALRKENKTSLFSILLGEGKCIFAHPVLIPDLFIISV